MLLPIVATAASLGELRVASSISEPFRATIDLLSATPAELLTLKASLAPEEAYLVQGIERTADHKGIKINVDNDPNGKKILKLSSIQPISEPFVDMLVVLEWENGRIVRQYTALLNPSECNCEVGKQTPPAINSFNNTSADESTSNINKSVKSKATVPAKRTAVKKAPTKEHLTRRGDTLSKIARRMRPDGVSLDRVLVALYEANPKAFVDNNMNRLKVGKILQAPSEEALSAITRKKAVKEIKLQTADWNKYRNKLAVAIVKRTPAANSEDTQLSSGKIKSAAEDQSTPKTKTPKDVVKLSTGAVDARYASMEAKMTALQEEISAREKGLKEAEERTAALEKQIADMHKLLTLKIDAMLEAQEKSAQITKNNVSEDKQLSFLSSFLDSVVGMFKQLDKMFLGAVAALITLLMTAWLYSRNKRSKKLADFEQGIMTSEQANVIDMSGISLDISDDSTLGPLESLTPVSNEMETKLELAAAYIDMEDKDGAKELLEEVLKEGSLSQRKRADQMLSSLV